ncbi:MAG: hypothetical protein WAU45_01635 [Blastocatellia bacterium]
MDHEENIKPTEKRRMRVSAAHNDVLVKVLDVPEADYECVMVNSPWPERGLLKGDIVLCNASSEGGAGDIVMIEEEGQVRLGILSTPGYLETPFGFRPLEASERIVGVGVALARRLSGAGGDFTF